MKYIGGLVIILLSLALGNTAFSQNVPAHQSSQPGQFPLVAQANGSSGGGNSGGSTGTGGGDDSGTGNEGGSNAGIGAPATSSPGSDASAMVSEATKTYATAAAMGDLFEIETSKLALTKSRSAEVKSFAKEMIQQHGELARKFKASVMKNHLAITLPATLDQQHRQVLNDLRQASASDFDKKYLAVQDRAHQEALQLHQLYSQNGDNTILRDEAKAIVPIVQDHIKHLQAVTEKLKSADAGGMQEIIAIGGHILDERIPGERGIS
jgi:putative membrane protein